MSVFVSSAVTLDAALLLSGLQSLAEPHGTAGSFQPLQCCPPHPQPPPPSSQLAGPVTLEWSLILSVPQCPHRYSRDSYSSYLMGLS